ncbi:RING finger protein 24-like [Scleropages formosus]|uniref:RING finger protein 24-like n=1 Tax=Scleropages formosus TaxID=113540 RepID=A0A0P7TG32_SCLFO|nr:RING finger protein 24-like [Scleropages formosus]
MVQSRLWSGLKPGMGLAVRFPESDFQRRHGGSAAQCVPHHSVSRMRPSSSMPRPPTADTSIKYRSFGFNHITFTGGQCDAAWYQQIKLRISPGTSEFLVSSGKMFRVDAHCPGTALTRSSCYKAVNALQRFAIPSSAARTNDAGESMTPEFQHYNFRMPNIGFQNLPLNIYIVVFGTAIFVFILSLLFCCYLIRLRHQAHKELYAYKQTRIKRKGRRHVELQRGLVMWNRDPM